MKMIIKKPKTYDCVADIPPGGLFRWSTFPDKVLMRVYHEDGMVRFVCVQTGTSWSGSAASYDSRKNRNAGTFTPVDGHLVIND